MVVVFVSLTSPPIPLVDFFFSRQDADGKLTTEDAKYYWRKFKDIMITRLPGGAGFAGGFFFGVKHG